MKREWGVLKKKVTYIFRVYFDALLPEQCLDDLYVIILRSPMKYRHTPFLHDLPNTITPFIKEHRNKYKEI